LLQYTPMSYTVYILQCADNSLYTGIAKDLAKRLEAHENGTGSKYVRSRLPFTLVHTELYPDRSQASIREAYIKRLSPTEKHNLCDHE